ncbi:hypothetical protein FB45DRAFT_886070 [Roridomyces roridus]|uniref:Uncharacterized protein n=1 Tax=Roridomyces roridus TaxID=1738132 RepID=A0AAD7G0N6_9AGAR|nr:hypothetical protein FB45DRAFT_886070 [Roridomyces roridus]
MHADQHKSIDDEVAEAARLASQAQALADDLKARAQTTEDPDTSARLLEESSAKQAEARKHSRRAHRLASGAWQGGTWGASMGAAIGVGLGATVGTLVGAIATIPTTGVGFLVGVPVGWIHGPWVGRKTKEQGNSAEKVEDDGGVGRLEEEGEAGESEEMLDEEAHRAVLAAIEAHDKAGTMA